MSAVDKKGTSNSSAVPPPSGQPASSPKPPPVSGEIPKGQELFYYIVECLDLGCDPADIRTQLLAFRYREADADKILADVVVWRQRNPGGGVRPNETNSSSSGGINANMAIGGFICLIGIAVTVFSFVVASHSSGRYVLAWGAILFGAIQFIRGAAQVGRERQASQTDAQGGSNQSESRR